ncbi:unnamed protein product [Cylicostephanus goldi]|uniref:Receptor ligand binding region domain-containing protein n=1 Tax=Cylicostephanus goldi TaxID=71465 RepID=A0A3P6RMK7_CYLGO|nr:unnamed protein product [Cylicostephanus goldi]
MAHLSNVYRKAWLGWGYVNNPEFSLADKYPLISTLAASAATVGQCALEVITRFRWDIVSIIYTSNEVRFCDDIMDSLMNSLSDANAAFTPRIALKQIVDPNDDESYKQTLRQIKARSRVVIFCMDLVNDRRGFLIKADQMGMTNNEYVFFMLGLRSNAFGQDILYRRLGH